MRKLILVLFVVSCGTVLSKKHSKDQAITETVIEPTTPTEPPKVEEPEATPTEPSEPEYFPEEVTEDSGESSGGVEQNPTGQTDDDEEPQAAAQCSAAMVEFLLGNEHLDKDSCLVSAKNLVEKSELVELETSKLSELRLSGVCDGSCPARCVLDSFELQHKKCKDGTTVVLKKYKKPDLTKQ